MTVGIGCTESLATGIRGNLGRLKSKIQLVSYGDSDRLLNDLGDTITAGVRGTLDSSSTMKGIRSSFGLNDVKRAAILEDSRGRPFLLAPVGIDEGRDYDSRLGLARAVISYFSGMKWELSVGILSKGRIEDSERGAEIKTSIKDGERMATELMKDVHFVKHYSILIEDAVKECDMILAPDGVSGNLIFRTLHFLGGCKAYGAPVVNLQRAVFVDTSRAKVDFTDSVLLAAGLDVARRKAMVRSVGP